MKVKFITEPKPQSLDTEIFLVGETYELSDASAERWIKRGVAELVKNKTTKKVK